MLCNHLMHVWLWQWAHSEYVSDVMTSALFLRMSSAWWWLTAFPPLSSPPLLSDGETRLQRHPPAAQRPRLDADAGHRADQEGKPGQIWGINTFLFIFIQFYQCLSFDWVFFAVLPPRKWRSSPYCTLQRSNRSIWILTGPFETTSCSWTALGSSTFQRAQSSHFILVRCNLTFSSEVPLWVLCL